MDYREDVLKIREALSEEELLKVVDRAWREWSQDRNFATFLEAAPFWIADFKQMLNEGEDDQRQEG